MPTACKRFLAYLGDDLDGALDGAARREFDRHCAECLHCRILRTTTHRTVQLYKNEQAPPIPIGVQLRLREALERQMTGRPPTLSN